MRDYDPYPRPTPRFSSLPARPPRGTPSTTTITTTTTTTRTVSAPSTLRQPDAEPGAFDDPFARRGSPGFPPAYDAYDNDRYLPPSPRREHEPVAQYATAVVAPSPAERHWPSSTTVTRTVTVSRPAAAPLSGHDVDPFQEIDTRHLPPLSESERQQTLRRAPLRPREQVEPDRLPRREPHAPPSLALGTARARERTLRAPSYMPRIDPLSYTPNAELERQAQLSDHTWSGLGRHRDEAAAFRRTADEYVTAARAADRDAEAGRPVDLPWLDRRWEHGVDEGERLVETHEAFEGYQDSLQTLMLRAHRRGPVDKTPTARARFDRSIDRSFETDDRLTTDLRAASRDLDRAGSDYLRGEVPHGRVRRREGW